MLVVRGSPASVRRGALVAVVSAILLLLPGCGPPLNREGVSVDALLEPSLSLENGQLFETWAEDGNGWYAWTVVQSTPILFERTELWCAQDASGVHARARISRYEESAAVSGVERDEVLGLQGTVRVSAPGLPIRGERRLVSYSLEGVREGETIRRAGSFEFESSELQHASQR